MADAPLSISQAQREKVEYIERMTHELSRIASGAGLPMLAYLLDMAGEEAALLRSPPRVRAAPLPPADGRTPRRPPD